MSGPSCQEEWDQLLAERVAVRARIAGAAAGISKRARDPFGLRTLVRGHPIASAFTGAGVAALITGLLTGRRHRADDDAPAASRRAAPGFGKIVRDVAVGALLPWLTRFATAKFAQHFGPDAAAPHADAAAPRAHAEAPNGSVPDA